MMRPINRSCATIFNVICVTEQHSMWGVYLHVNVAANKWYTAVRQDDCVSLNEQTFSKCLKKNHRMCFNKHALISSKNSLAQDYLL